MRLKAHESPRQQGRNKRGRGGTARKRQLDKRNRAIRQTLQNNSSGSLTEKQLTKQKANQQKQTDPYQKEIYRLQKAGQVPAFLVSTCWNICRKSLLKESIVL